ncbi:ubiquitin carboxyl-terminal hydrolase 8 isoform X2 [Bacillus rossius redtenbacheri]|uniref:ubiquitin carboxyl-terminal hydrolase 8 isoform X2 n=1 Tax=Bacillus rossius redtenbacheri TaxID=93214 RepID=UPI002FDE78F3
MPEKKRKELYMGKTILDLQKHYDLSKLGSAKTKLLCNTATKLYAEAEKYQRDGDEEMCYITLMKFLGLVTKIRLSKDYQEDKKFVINLLGPHRTQTALEWAERLSHSLENRYKLREEIEQSQLANKIVPDTNSKPNNAKSFSNTSSPKNYENAIQEPWGSTISCTELYKLLAEAKKKILIFDVRPTSDYNNSHITLTEILHIPEELVENGMSAAKLGNCLPAEAKTLFERRGLVDLVVLMDWFSLDNDLPAINKLSILRSILTKWDPGVEYKHKPVVLKGGYQEWLDTYPSFTSNPRAGAPSQSSGDSLDSLLNSIEYADLDGSAEKPPARTVAQPGDTAQSPLQPWMPVVDRSSKPHVSVRVPSGGSQVSSVSAEETADGLPDSSPTDGDGDTHSIGAERSEGSLPVVDRAAKARALQRYKELSREREAAAERALQLARARDDVEGEWLEVRARREGEADRELGASLQEQEEQLLKKILRLESELQVTDEENKALRKALESMRKEKEAAENVLPVSNTEIADIEQRIRSKEAATDSLEKKRKEDADKRQAELEKARATKPATMSAKYVPLKDEGTSGSSGQIKRSHSFPNLAQMVDDEAVSVKQRVPKYDRAIKPVEKAQAFETNAARSRIWNATYGRAGQGLTGLKNLGNSCYMNSIIQCISNTTSLAFYFVEGQHHNDMNKSAKTCGRVVEEVAAVVRKLWSGQLRSIAAYDLKAVVGQLKSSFKGTEQQDSHEFFTLIMDWLHQELNKKSGISPKMSKSLSKLPPDEVEWEKFRSSNDSIIQTLFFGQQTSTVTCCTCSEKSVTYEPFSTLSLPLPSSVNKCTLQEMSRKKVIKRKKRKPCTELQNKL